MEQKNVPNEEDSAMGFEHNSEEGSVGHVLQEKAFELLKEEENKINIRIRRAEKEIQEAKKALDKLDINRFLLRVKFDQIRPVTYYLYSGSQIPLNSSKKYKIKENKYPYILSIPQKVEVCDYCVYWYYDKDCRLRDKEDGEMFMFACHFEPFLDFLRTTGIKIHDLGEGRPKKLKPEIIADVVDNVFLEYRVSPENEDYLVLSFTGPQFSAELYIPFPQNETEFVEYAKYYKQKRLV